MIDESVFQSTKIAALSDLKTELWQKIYDKLENDQTHFLKDNNKFISEAYLKKWPIDALHWWSRVWEYPFIYYHLRQIRETTRRDIDITVVDYGSGITFFPFSVAQLGYNVICMDNDRDCQEGVIKAIRQYPSEDGKVSFKMVDNGPLPVRDEVVDIIYSISVMEHVLDIKSVIHELARILKQNGFLFLTIDLDLTGKLELGVSKYYEFIALIERYFDYAYVQRTVHLGDILYSQMGPYPLKTLGSYNMFKYNMKHRLLPLIIGKQPAAPIAKYNLAVQGFCLRKR